VPLSREEGRLADLKRALVLYRLVFGQPRQEELVEMLARMGLPENQVDEMVEKLRIDLTPRGVGTTTESLNLAATPIATTSPAV
jgi:hypothetical protein